MSLQALVVNLERAYECSSGFDGVACAVFAACIFFKIGSLLEVVDRLKGAGLGFLLLLWPCELLGL